LAREAARLRAAGTVAAALDVPLLLESGWDRLCDRLVFVDAPRGLRLARAQERGWSEAEFAAREAAQESLEAKRRRADVVVDNSGSPDATRAQVARLWQALVG
jgi:dephospho-CoA kinase